MKPSGAIAGMGVIIAGRGHVIVRGFGAIHQMEMPFEFHVEPAVFYQHVTFQVCHTNGQGFQQRAHNAFEEILAGVTLVFFFDMDVTVVIHNLYGYPSKVISGSYEPLKRLSIWIKGDVSRGLNTL
jgi:hypothetical protein